MSKNTVRFSLDVSPEVNEILDDLAATTNGTKSDVVRKAIALMKVAVDGKQKGLKLGLADKDEILTTEIVGL